MPHDPTALHRRHAIHFKVERPRPRMNEHEDARWRVFREIPVIDGVEGREARGAGHTIDITFDHLPERRAGGLETMLDLLQHQFALSLKRLWLDLAAFGIKRRQAGQIDEAVGNGDRMRHSTLAITLQIGRNRLNPNALDHAGPSRVTSSS